MVVGSPQLRAPGVRLPVETAVRTEVAAPSPSADCHRLARASGGFGRDVCCEP